MNIYDVIRGEHEEVSQLMEKAIETGRVRGNREERRLALNRVRDLLEHHMRSEEQLFYPILAGQEITDEDEPVDVINTCRQDHAQVRDELMELIDDVDDPKFIQRLQAIQQDIEDHVALEEADVFEKAEILLTDEEADRLGDQFQEERRRSLGERREEEGAGVIRDVPVTGDVDAMIASRGQNAGQNEPGDVTRNI